jgi:hypothetical protein
VELNGILMGIGYISGQALMQGAKGGIDNQSLINGFSIKCQKLKVLCAIQGGNPGQLSKFCRKFL